MKKVLILCLVLFCFLSSVSNVYAVNYGPMRKLARGMSNIVTCPLELPHRIENTKNRSGWYEALTIGLSEGVLMVVTRAVAGVYETAFFLLPMPLRYEPIVNDPEFFWKGNDEN